VLKRRLDVDEDQELVVDHAVADSRDALRELGDALADVRGDLAEALRGAEVDDAGLQAAFGRTDEALARARRHLVSAVKQVHAVLDEEQRELLAATVDDWDLRGRL